MPVRFCGLLVDKRDHAAAATDLRAKVGFALLVPRLHDRNAHELEWAFIVRLFLAI